MILFAENITSRLQFVCEFVGNEILNEPIKLTNDKSAYLSNGEPKINYSKPANNRGLHVPHPSLRI
jgi:hypothetical protein